MRSCLDSYPSIFTQRIIDIQKCTVGGGTEYLVRSMLDQPLKARFTFPHREL